MSIVVVTGSAGLIGSAASRRFAEMGLEIVGMDNSLRAEFFKQARSGEAYNIGGGRRNSASVTEAPTMSEEISGNRIYIEYCETNRVGDHIWWMSSKARFEDYYPAWRQTHALRETLSEIFEQNLRRWRC